jgi:hypothetical protein
MLLKLLEKIGRKRIVMDRVNNEPYLERYYLFLKDRDRFPFNVFLHKFLKSDPDDLHDHPWPYATLILKGGYYEWIPLTNSKGEKFGETSVWRGPGHFRVCRADSFHRIELDPAVTCWTLFMPGPKQREWGFLTKGKWVQWEQYLEGRNARNSKT